MGNRVGQNLGNYHLIRFLGEGSFAEVYLCEHIYLKHLAAIKVLRTFLPDEYKADFVAEAQHLVRLRHPNIIRLLEFGIEGDVPFLIMEDAPHGTLRTRHPKGSQLPLETIVFYVRQIADALQYLHDQKLVHRDIKPENILLGPNQEILVSDLGLAVVAHTTGSIVEQNQAGTPAYIAPEQIQTYPRPASDQYSLGIMVYEWLSGTRPFQGNPLALMHQHMSTPPPTLQGQFPTIFPIVEEVVFKALAKDSKQRFACVRDFAVALEQAYQEAKRFDFDSPAQHTPSSIQVGESSALPLERGDSSNASPHGEGPRLTNPLVNTDQSLLMNVAIPPQINHDGEIQQMYQLPLTPPSPGYSDLPYQVLPPSVSTHLLSESLISTFRSSPPPLSLAQIFQQEARLPITNALQLPSTVAGRHEISLPTRNQTSPRSFAQILRLLLIVFSIMSILIISAFSLMYLTMPPSNNENMLNTPHALTSATTSNTTATLTISTLLQVLARGTASIIQTATTGAPDYQDALNDATNVVTIAAKWDGVDGTDSHCTFQSDGYHVTEGVNLVNFYGCRETGKTYKNAAIVVNMNIISGHTGGLFFRVNINKFNNHSGGYLFEVDSQGNYRISTVSGTSTTPLPGHDWTLTTALKQGNNVTNTLQAIVQGTTFLFYANDTFLTRATDATFTSAGDIAFLATTAGAKADIVYSDLKVYPLA